MDDRTITLGSLRDQYNATYAGLDRTCADLQSVCAIVGELDPFLPDFESGQDIRVSAATLRSQADHALKASLSLSAAASSFEALACVVSSSVEREPGVAAIRRPVALATAKRVSKKKPVTRSRKRSAAAL
jgi:hypothetical protein